MKDDINLSKDGYDPLHIDSGEKTLSDFLSDSFFRDESEA
jgi:hypothetical protein